MLIGIDYASVDGNAAPDFEQLKSACIAQGARLATAIFRVAWGTQPDRYEPSGISTVGRDWQRAVDAGLLCGGYLFLRLPHGSFHATPEEQVRAFAELLPAMDEGCLVPTIDVEDSSAAMAPEAELEWVHRAWLEMRSIYGVPPMIYTSERVWREDLANLPAGEMVDSPLWLAKPWPWPVRTPARLASSLFDAGAWEPVVPRPWGARNWWFHQYQGDAFPVPGFTSTVDLSRMRLMRLGDIGPRVAWVQKRLGMTPSGTPAIATFDGDMLQKVRAFQKEHSLMVDGAIGPQTFCALAWSRPPRTLSA